MIRDLIVERKTKTVHLKSGHRKAVCQSEEEQFKTITSSHEGDTSEVTCQDCLNINSGNS